MKERNWKYKITGNWFGPMVIAITTAVSGGFTFWLYTAHDGAFVGLGGLTAFFAIICVLSAYGAMSFKLLVDKDGFYFRTKPGNGRYYRYSDILDCCLVESQLDSKMDFDSLTKIGAMIGSGGLVVMDEDTCMVEVARFFMNFTQRESCGKCVPCREGTKRMLEILERIVEGNGKLSDLDELEELADMIESTALCGLGKSAPKPVISTIHAFREEYEEHILKKHCKAGVCSNLRTYKIDLEKCKGCSKCARNCPVNAITGKIKTPFVIDNEKCIKCGTCKDNCAFGAIYTE